MVESGLARQGLQVLWTGSRAGSSKAMRWTGLVDKSLVPEQLWKEMVEADGNPVEGRLPIVDGYGASKYATDLCSVRRLLLLLLLVFVLEPLLLLRWFSTAMSHSTYKAAASSSVLVSLTHMSRPSSSEPSSPSSPN